MQILISLPYVLLFVLSVLISCGIVNPDHILLAVYSLPGLQNTGREAFASRKVLPSAEYHQHDRNDSGSGSAGWCRRDSRKEARAGRGFPLAWWGRNGTRWVSLEEAVFGQGLHRSCLVVLGLFVQVTLSSFLQRGGVVRFGMWPEGTVTEEEDICANDDDEC